MRNFNFLSKSSSQSCGHSSVTLASTVGSPSAHRRGIMLRLLSVLVLIFTFGIGQMWGATEDFNASASDLADNTKWTGTHSGKYSGDQSLKLDDSGEYVSKTDIWSGDKSAKMTALTVWVNAKINGTAKNTNQFTVDALDKDGNVLATKTLTEAWSSNYEDHEFVLEGTFANVTGLKLTYTFKTSSGGNVGIASIKATITYSTTCTVTYNANGATTGNVPTDNTEYNPNATVTVLGNTGNLARTGCTFAGWNTKADGTGTTYAANATFSISANTTLYAKWTATVTWKANNVIVKTDDIVVPADGKEVALPTTEQIGANKCGDRIMGWTEFENHKANTAPADLFTAAPTVQGSKTYYAVFADYAE